MPAGGPHTMTITGTNTIVIKNILIGDVWVCSGQSNMELPMERVRPIYEAEIANCENANIRHFSVPQKYDFVAPQADLSAGTWEQTNPQTILKFSAAGYFFARELYAKYKVPIGLINASLGGSPAEAWMSAEALQEFPAYYQEAQRFKDANLIRQIETDDKVRIDAWHAQLRAKDAGYQNPTASWKAPELNSSDWTPISLPGYWKDSGLGSVNGAVWFRREIILSDALAGQPALLILGRLVDADSTFINGAFVGTTSYQWPPRRYAVSPGILKTGKNVITVRLVNSSGQGGFVPEKQYALVIGDQTFDLSGQWNYRLGAVMPPLAGQTFIRWKPLGLYNGMLAPLLSYRITGVIWYQGEANAGRALEYRTLFPAMIQDWRRSWRQGDFPFLFVQLTSFMAIQEQPSESNWALLRESQTKTLAIPNTAMAVTIDIGETGDIHPLNKKDVGIRLARAALRLAYGEKIVHSGPIYQSMQIADDKLIISFTETGSGLVARDGELRQFAIAGADRKFVWAKARIEGNQIVVWSEQVKSPVAVRYAWADNPLGANLYNQEGLPASPFRTDEW